MTGLLRPRSIPGPVLLLALCGCTEPNPQGRKPSPTDLTASDSGTSPPAVDTSTSRRADSGTPGADTGDTGTPSAFDCSTIPVAPLTLRPVPGARAYHGLAFTPDDKLVGSDNNALLKVDFTGGLEVLVAALGVVQQMDWIPDGSGDLAVARDSNQSIVRVTSAGAVTVLAADIGAYGVTAGPDGKIWTANTSEIHRIDPATGQKTVVVGGGYAPKVLDFNREGTRLYFGTLGGGHVYAVDLDGAFDPIGPPQRIATGIGGWHDGLGVDVCGNIYVADFNTRSMYRISPNGTIHTLFDPDPDLYGHGLVWGVSTGGWKDTALYVPQPYNGNTVAELDIGVPSRRWTGDVVGAVPF